jgi:hypothetical protein
MRTLLLFTLTTIGISGVLAQTGQLKGKVTDARTGEELVGATIIIDGTTNGTITDFMGEYSLPELPAGTYNFKCQYISYEPSVFNNITIKNGETTQLDIKLKTVELDLQEVKVVAKANRASETMLLMEQKNSVLATQAIGAQELSRKGVSDAEGAVSKVSGISKQDGVKNVFVRGLGDRYNTTTLNGFVMPSEDPEYKNISLDFFTNDIIQAVTVNKVFAAGMTGDVGGAIIDIKSKELLGESEFEIGIGSSLNSETIGKDFLQPEGLNKLGYSTATYGPTDNLRDYDFNTSLNPIESNDPNLNISFSGGKKFRNKHSFFVAGSMGNDYRFEEGNIREITSSGATDPFVDMTYTRSIRNSSNLLMGNLGLNYSKLKIAYNAMYIHIGSAYHADMYGKHSERFQIADDFGSQGYTRRQQLNDNTLFVNQIILKGELTDRITYNIGTSVNSLAGKEPDRRIFRFPSLGGESVELARAQNTNERFSNEINELAIVPKLNLQYKLTTVPENVSRLEVGYDARISNKDFIAPFYNHTWNPLVTLPTFPSYKNIDLDAYINQEALTNNDFSLDYFNDNYTVDRIMHGAYIDLVYQLGKSVVINPGLRFDYVFAETNYEVNRGADVGSSKLEEFLYSPSVNIKYTQNDKSHFRFGTSRTFTLPQDKETSPFVTNSFDGYIGGNADLEVSTNYNIDLKWDYYISGSELITLNAFYKHILKPIARVDQNNSAGIKTYDNIGDHAVATGIEAEMRKKIMSIANKHHFNLGINASYIHTQHYGLDAALFVQNTNTAMEGATPYILNADLSYNMQSGKIDVNSALVINYLGDKVHTIGTGGFNNLMEESITTIDFVNSFKIDKKIDIKLKAMNLLNPLYKQTREGAAAEQIPPVVIRSYKKGVQLSLGITYKF